MLLHACHNFCRPNDLSTFTKSKDPREELRAGDDLHGDGKAGRGGDKDLITAEAVKDDIGHAVFVVGELQGDALRLAAVHPEDLSGIFGGVKAGKQGLPQPLFAGLGDAFHLIHPVVAALAVLGVVANQVVVFVIPQKRPRADLIALAAVAIAFLPGGVPIEIAEGDAAACGDGAADREKAGDMGGLGAVPAVRPCVFYGVSAALAGLVVKSGKFFEKYRKSLKFVLVLKKVLCYSSVANL